MTAARNVRAVVGLLVAPLLVLAVHGPVVLAQSAPVLLNYQGRLTDPMGTPIAAPTAAAFKILRGGTATEPISSGTTVYAETTTVVPDASGVFTHVIGTGIADPGETLTESDFDTSGSPLYVEVSITSDPLLPRTRVLSVPYAIESSRVGGMTAQAIIGQAGGNAFANAVVRNGAGLEWLSVSQILIRPGTLGFPDGAVRQNTSAITWDLANPAGPLGLDTGAEIANTWYYLYAVPDPVDGTRFSAVASIQAPTQIGGSGPTGFPTSRFLGSFRNNSSSNIWRFFRQGSLVSWGKTHVYWLLRNNQSLPNVNTWNAVNASDFMPLTSQFIWVNGYYDSCGTAKGRFQVGPGPATPPSYIWFCTDFDAGATTCDAVIPTIDRTFSWKFESFNGTANDSCQYAHHDYVGYLEDVREF